VQTSYVREGINTNAHWLMCLPVYWYCLVMYAAMNKKRLFIRLQKIKAVWKADIIVFGLILPWIILFTIIFFADHPRSLLPLCSLCTLYNFVELIWYISSSQQVKIKHCIWVISTPALYCFLFEQFWVEISAQRPAIMTEVFYGFTW
jgi:hypothetical protein